ncbi:hypothetical protein QQX98_007027 [Neonectria punicea]|uniref:Protein kinase domain-containing protein n=1 Tax=Neonectria punicea TaxID=979145 RepID=A0ABR1GZ27_9HYPO
MKDVDLVAHVYPCDEIASAAIRTSRLYVPGTNPPRLELRFSNHLSNVHGFAFGSGNDCAVKIPDNYASSLHFAVSFDKERRLVVKDLGSPQGTQVTYGGHGSGVRRNFTWIIGGHEMTMKNKPIVIKLSSNLCFQIEAAHPNVDSRAYIDMNTEPIYLESDLGKGGFGTVILRSNVSNGREVAVKRPTGNTYDVAAWVKECKSMRNLDHPHIVKFLESDFTTVPELRLEYMPHGSLHDHLHAVRTNPKKAITALHQCLGALSYLHTSATPIVHRDIKPGNILVHHQDNDSICVKLADFGLSQQAFRMNSNCGTPRYMAPEIGLTSYNQAVDVWALGVVGYEMTRDLGHSGGGGLVWCKKITTKRENDNENWPCNPMLCTLEKMLVMSPKSRSSSKVCEGFVSRVLRSGVADDLKPIWTLDPNPGDPDLEDRGAVIEEPLTNMGNVLGKRVLGSPDAGTDEAAAASNPRKRIRLDEATARQDSEHRIAEAQQAAVPSSETGAKDTMGLSSLLESLPREDGNSEDHHGASSAVAKNPTQGSVGDETTQAFDAQGPVGDETTQAFDAQRTSEEVGALLGRSEPSQPVPREHHDAA